MICLTIIYLLGQVWGETRVSSVSLGYRLTHLILTGVDYGGFRLMAQVEGNNPSSKGEMITSLFSTAGSEEEAFT